MSQPVPEPPTAAPEAAPLPMRAEPAMTAGEAAFAVLRAQYRAMRDEEAAVLGGENGEAPHRMHAAIRRLRTALAVFHSALPVRAAAHRERLDQLGSALAAVRDIDVQLEQIAAWAAAASAGERDALDAVRAALDERRGKARQRVLVVSSSARWRRSLESLERFLASGPLQRSPAARVPILDLAPVILEQEYRDLVQIADPIEPDAPAEALQALRGRCERLGDTVEFFAPLYGKAARRYLKPLVAAQDLLGDHHDTVVAAATLHDVALDRKRRLAPAQLMTLGALVERSQKWASAARELLPDRYRKVTGRRWRKLIAAAQSASADRSS